MKIIKQPDTQNWIHNLTCIHCDAQLEINADDLILKHYDGDQREPSYDQFSVICETCKSPITVLTNSVQKLIQLNLKRKQR